MNIDHVREEIARRGQAIYDARLRADVEPGNKGKFLVVDVETGGYVMDRDSVTAYDLAAARYPGHSLYVLRVGYPSAVTLGGHFRASVT